MLVQTRLWLIISEGCYRMVTAVIQVTLVSTTQHNLREVLRTKTLSSSNALSPWTVDLCWETEDWKITPTFLLISPPRAGTKVASKIVACLQFPCGGDAQSRGSLQHLSYACPSQQLNFPLTWPTPSWQWGVRSRTPSPCYTVLKKQNQAQEHKAKHQTLEDPILAVPQMITWMMFMS